MTTPPLNGTSRLLVPAVNEAPNWQTYGPCGTMPDLFFPSGNSQQTHVETAQAKAVCHRCPVEQTCLEWALTTGQDYGIFGGKTAQERRLLHGRSPLWFEERGRSRMAELMTARHEELEELFAQNLSNREIAERISTSAQMVVEIRKRMTALEQGVSA
ncbi:WhiB family transcriptional regulator [Streptomyces sp. NPDC056982]|uniref:WhiB family transcriptional regulator n=1 Tax=Streptomyces sp. NPDC056982 TaxID=3345986 RepID=UPI00364316CD